MNQTWRTRAAGLAIVALGTAGVGLAGWSTVAVAAPTPDPGPAAPATTDATLVKNLSFMREEERLARDLYQALASQYDNALPFSRITVSEQRHFDTLGLLLTRYGIADPASGRAAGSYADPGLQKLYDDLVAKGRTSLAAAYEVGIAVETEDIADLKAAITETAQADAKQVFTNLLRGSENHLAAFTAAKDGRAVGAGTRQGMRSGGRWADDDSAPGAGGGFGRGAGPGRGGVPSTRPADCPVR